MPWLLLGLGLFLILSGVLGQVYSLKTKRGVLHPKTRVWRVLVRLSLVVAGLVLIGFAMLLISHRSPRAAAFFQRLRPGSTA